MEVRRMIIIVKSFILILTPIVLGILTILLSLSKSDKDKRAKLSYQLGWVYVFLLCGIYWMFNILSIPAVSFLPIFVFPLIGLLEARGLAMSFLSSYNAMIFGSIVLMMAADTFGLIKRLTLAILKHSSGSIRWIFMDIYLATIWIAMWVNSCAAVFLMMRVIDEVLDNLKAEFGAMGEERSTILRQIERKSQQQQEEGPMISSKNAYMEATNEGNDLIAKAEENVKDQQAETYAAAIKTFHNENENLLNDFGGDLLFAIAVAANIGGTFWPYGNPMGYQIMKTRSIMDGLTEASWLIYSFPLLVMNASIALAFLMWLHFNKRLGRSVKSFLVSKKQRVTDFTQGPETLETIGKIFAEKYALLPIWKIREKLVILLMVVAIVVCLTKHPVFVSGWDEVIQRESQISGVGESVPLIGVTLLLFLIPSWSLQTFKGPPSAGDKSTAAPNKLGWKKIQSTYPYTVLILIVGSECIGRTSETTVAPPIAEFLTKILDGKSMRLVTLVMMIITASVSIFLPNPGTSFFITQLCYGMTIMANKTWVIIHAEYLLSILSVACLRFVIPASSIPTAMVYGYKGNKTLSALYFLRVGIPLFISTIIPTILYALLWAPNDLSLSVIFTMR